MPLTVRRSSFAEDPDADNDTADINDLIHFKNKLYSGSQDGKIKVWDKNLKLLKTVQAHSRAIFSLTAGNDSLYSCSNDGTVKAWSLDNVKGKGTILVDQHGLMRIWFGEDTLYAGDNEGTVKLFVDDKADTTLHFSEPMKDMMVNGDFIYMMRESDLVITESYPDEKGNCATKKTIEGRSPMCFAGNKLCLVGKSGKDILVHENTLESEFKEAVRQTDAHDMLINTLCGVKTNDVTLLYSGGWDKIIKQWKLEGNAIKKISTCPVDMFVNVIAAGPKGEIYVGGSDGRIVRINK